MEAWHVFIIIGTILIGAEIIVPSFVLVPIGISSLLTALFAYFIPGITWQLLFFSIIVCITFITFSKWRAMFFPKNRQSSDIGIIGKIGTITEASESPAKPGKVKLYGDIWDILPESATKLIPVGTKVTVISISGNKVVVEPIIK